MDFVEYTNKRILDKKKEDEVRFNGGLANINSKIVKSIDDCVSNNKDKFKLSVNNIYNNRIREIVKDSKWRIVDERVDIGHRNFTNFEIAFRNIDKITEKKQTSSIVVGLCGIFEFFTMGMLGIMLGSMVGLACVFNGWWS